ncbi:MAG: hypothetical protein HQL45_14665 [Alphaproteobacteria bacterium]|nr:hypothetical protein [Alphaproteobacteria bacterium]
MTMTLPEETAKEAVGNPLVALLAVLAGGLILALPTFWNGFPFIFYDTTDYLHGANNGPIAIYRTYPYSIALIALLGRVSLWWPALLQNLIASWVIFEAIRAFAPRAIRPERLLPVIAVLLTGLTALPWYSGQIMPDVFSGIAALSIAVVAFGGQKLGLARRLALAGIITVAAAVHSTHLLTATALVFGLLLLRFLPWTRWLAPAPALPLAAVLAAYLVVLGSHWALAGRPYLNDAGPVFLFARFLESGLAQKTLEEMCPDPRLPRMCAHSDALPDDTNKFLWGGTAKGSPFDDMGNFSELRGEASIVILESVRRFPILHLASALRVGLTQFVTLESGEGIRVSQSWLLQEVMAQYYPKDAPAFHAARQQETASLGWLFDRLNQVHVPVAWLGYLATIWLLLLGWWRQDRLLTALPLVAGTTLLVNAILCGALSAVADRYQNRLWWIAVLAGLVGSLMALKRKA